MIKAAGRKSQLIQLQRDAMEKLKACQKDLASIESMVMQLSPLLGAFDHLSMADRSIRRAIFCLDDTGESEQIMERRF